MIYIKWFCHHVHFPIVRIYPFSAWPITVELDTDTIWITEIECFWDTMITSTIKRIICINKSLQDFCEFESWRKKYRKMIESTRTRWRRRHSFAFPSIETDMMMISPCWEKNSRVSISCRYFESEYVTIKREGAIEISHCEMYMSDSCLRMESHEKSIETK